MSEFKLYVYDKITKAVISGYNGIDITGNSYTITGLTDNTEYTIKMRRYDENGNLSNISKTKDVITDNATIPNILVTNENFARFEVYFDAIPNASGYLVYLSKDGNPVNNYNPYFSNTNDFAITGLTPESTYSFYIETSYGGKTSQPSDTYTAITETVNLDNPSNLVISNVNYRFSTITWDSVLDATHYDVYIENLTITGMNQYWDTISISGEANFPASITGSNSFTYDNGVPQQPFRYYVKARYYNYESDYMQSASGSFSIVPDTTALEETNVTTSGFTINFNKVLDIGNVNQSGYYVYLYKDSILQNTIVLTNQNGGVDASFINGSSGFVTLTSGMVSATGMNEVMYILKPNGSYETNLEILDNTTYTYKIKPHYNYYASSGFSNEISVITDEIIIVPTTRDLVLNSNTAIYLPFRDGTANNSYGAGNGGVIGGIGSTTYPSGILSGDDTYLNLSADYNWVRITNTSALDTVDLTIDLAFQFTSLKTTNLLASKYQTITSATYRRFYIDYYQPTNEFRISLHNPTMNIGDYAQWNVAFTPSLDTNYLVTLAIDTTNNVIKFFINGVEKTMSFIGGSLGGIAGVDWSTFEQADVLICAYADPSGINSSANLDANIRLFRFGYHKEYRNLAVHTQSYNNLFSLDI